MFLLILQLAFMQQAPAWTFCGAGPPDPAIDEPIEPQSNRTEKAGVWARGFNGVSPLSLQSGSRQPVWVHGTSNLCIWRWSAYRKGRRLS